MKFLCTLFIALSITPQVFAQTCLPEGIVFTTQTGIDNFPSNYPECSIIQGDVIIDDMEINTVTNVDSLIYLTEIQGNLHIGTQYATPYFNSLVGFSNLTNIGGDLDIGGNFDLYSLTGLESLTTIDGILDIHGNNYLTNLTGLDNLNSVEEIKIRYNDGLTSLTGLDNVDYTTVSNLIISHNDLLTMCSISSVCNYLNSENPSVYIVYNNTGCESQTQVEEMCITGINNYLNNIIDLYPNPANDKLHLSISNNIQLKKVRIYSISGQIIVEQNISSNVNQIINISDLMAGIYLFEVETIDGYIDVVQFIKEY
jgi:hypothetical protein